METSLLQIEVWALTRGEPAEGLAKEDFVLTENGQSRETATLEYVPPPTVTIKPSSTESPEPADEEPAPPTRTLVYVAQSGGANGTVHRGRTHATGVTVRSRTLKPPHSAEL